MQRIRDGSSIFTAEAKAVDLALDFIRTSDTINKFIIFSDSLSVLNDMNNTRSKNPQIQTLLEKCHELLANKEIEPRHGFSNNVVCASSKASDQPAHTRSLIRGFASCLNII